ncbi:hypothetical protein EYF80_000134 [Liparis tanakae]|uniref:Uncharacterized protein n=1 Tax=Liparis tanakae TaxID=230148 RepID=A0A4Z2JHY5_9TELE|nr:hypothetical protein EYF80_000134 [Liparis tanakae]
MCEKFHLQQMRLIPVVEEGWRGGGVEREAGRRAAARPPTACWEKELEPGAELEGSTEARRDSSVFVNPRLALLQQQTDQRIIDKPLSCG